MLGAFYFVNPGRVRQEEKFKVNVYSFENSNEWLAPKK